MEQLAHATIRVRQGGSDYHYEPPPLEEERCPLCDTPVSRAARCVDCTRMLAFP